jgi:serine/threonine protein kinase
MTDDDPMIGQLLADRYALTRVVGRGGMASVYQAWDTRLERFVAVKIFTVGTANSDSRRQTEVKLLARVNHPNLVTLHDAHLAPRDSSAPSYLVMELVEGPDLGSRLAQGAPSGEEIAAIAVDLADALVTIHEAEVVHRDLKPGNILLAPTGLPSPAYRAKIGDFGIAHMVGAEPLTTVGTVVGTAAYLSPEQAVGSDAGPESDIYALGLLLLESFTGQRAFSGTVVEAVSAKISRDPVVPVGVPPGWAALLTRMTARDPQLRPTALELSGAFRELSPELVGWSRDDLEGDVSTVATQAMLAPTKVLPVAASTVPLALPVPIADGGRPDRTLSPTVPVATVATVATTDEQRKRPRTRGGLIAALSLVAGILVAVIVGASTLSQHTAPASGPGNTITHSGTTSTTPATRESQTPTPASASPTPTATKPSPTPAPSPTKPGKGHGKGHKKH